MEISGNNSTCPSPEEVSRRAHGIHGLHQDVVDVSGSARIAASTLSGKRALSCCIDADRVRKSYPCPCLDALNQSAHAIPDLERVAPDHDLELQIALELVEPGGLRRRLSSSTASRENTVVVSRNGTSTTIMS